ncbi:MAG TPA: hypothetical protein VIY86_08375 [Pirellulaceae bacterium]
MFLTVLILIVMIVCIALLWNEGMWGNALTLVNVVLAALLATSYYEPVATMMEARMPSFTYICDFLAIWSVFSLSLLILRTTTDQISKHRVRFKMPVEVSGRIGFAILTAWVFACFFVATLHVSPLARTAIRGSFEPTIMGTRFLGLSPDRYWLAFVHSRSGGALSRREPSVFDAEGDWIPKYAARRKSFEDYNKREGKLRVRGR